MALAKSNKRFSPIGEDIPHGSKQEKYFLYEPTGLTFLHPLPSYPYNDLNRLRSLKDCFRGFLVPEINEVIYKRIQEIARINYFNHIYLYLISGENSIAYAEQQNRNHQDGCIYIGLSEDDCSNEVKRGIELYNTETSRLKSLLLNQ